VKAHGEVVYRLELAQGHLGSASRLFQASLWSESPRSSQLSVKGSATAVIAAFRPIAKMHDVVPVLLDVEDEFETGQDRRTVERLASLAQRRGMKEHSWPATGIRWPTKPRGSCTTRTRRDGH
jgi:hypothetical protein